MLHVHVPRSYGQQAPFHKATTLTICKDILICFSLMNYLTLTNFDTFFDLIDYLIKSVLRGKLAAIATV